MEERWASDLSDVATELERMNESGFFKERLDLDKLGVFGHSRGGGSAGEALLMDDRFKAGANLDGVQWGKIVDTAFNKPFLYISADWPADHEDLNAHAYINKSNEVFYEGLIENTGHSSFMDIPLMVPVSALSQAGTIDPEEALKISTSTVVSFFDKHLKNQEVDMNSVASNFNALQFKIFEGREIGVQQQLANH
jgi:predicted dienelactone hydrolase